MIGMDLVKKIVAHASTNLVVHKEDVRGSQKGLADRRDWHESFDA